MARMKRKSLRWQVERALVKKLCIGQSKNQSKKIAKEEGKKTPDGIYSWSTFNSYKKHCIQFVEWAKKEKGCRTIEEVMEYIQEYMDWRVENGLSAWTVHLDCSAIMKMYGVSAIDMDIKVPERKRADIKRSRNACEHDRHVSEEKNKDIVDYCKGTGLRRHELAAIKPEYIRCYKGNVYVIVMRGKGGKKRFVEVLNEYKDHITKCHKVETNRVFQNIPQNIDIHSYRAWFACQWYKRLERPLEQLTVKQKYYCRGEKKKVVYDKKAMVKVSKLLGHNRKNVIANNYLWNMEQ